MSDKVAEENSNDVLSSVRRLVSDVDTNTKASPERLVLTPSLRVVDDVATRPLVLGTVAKARFFPEQEGYDPTAKAGKAVRGSAPSIASKKAETPQVDREPKKEPQRAPYDLTAKFEALETAVASSEEEFEPDDPDHLKVVGVEPQQATWDDAVDGDEETVEENLPAEIQRPDEPEKASVSAQDVAFVARHSRAAQAKATALDTLDEEALNDLVVQIVHKELSGPLGERITRNVRKMVRREIYRALAAQDLD